MGSYNLPNLCELKDTATAIRDGTITTETRVESVVSVGEKGKRDLDFMG